MLRIFSGQLDVASGVAAGGLLNMLSFATGCVCNYPLQTSFSMVYMPEAGKWAGEKPLEVSVEKEK